jgi:SRSO17 transposase
VRFSLRCAMREGAPLLTGILHRQRERQEALSAYQTCAHRTNAPSDQPVARTPTRVACAAASPRRASRSPSAGPALPASHPHSDIPRNNGWQSAEHARHAHPSAMHRVLSRAVWDQDGVRDARRSALVQTLLPSSPSPEPDPLFPLLVLDERGFPTRGRHSADFQPQECGVSGRVDTCQVGVFLSSVTALGHGLIDRALDVPEEWCRDPVRRLAAPLPESLPVQTTPERALRMVPRAQQAGVSIRWVVADPVSGHGTDVRLWLEEQGDASVFAVPSIEVVAVQTRDGCLLADVATIGQQALRPHDWQRLSQSLGPTGERLFDWAIVPVVQQGTVDDRHVLVCRRCLNDPSQVTASLVFAPVATPLSTIVQVIGARWHIEEDLHATTDLGLDQDDVRRSLGWSRHVTLVLLASAFLIGLCVQDRSHPSPHPEPPACAPLIALTPSEAQHLLAHLFWPAPSSAPLICHWSCWRRTHQEWAGSSHRRRRQHALPPGRSAARLAPCQRSP